MSTLAWAWHSAPPHPCPPDAATRGEEGGFREGRATPLWPQGLLRASAFSSCPTPAPSTFLPRPPVPLSSTQQTFTVYLLCVGPLPAPPRTQGCKRHSNLDTHSL